MASNRPQKIFKLNYWKANPEYAAQISLYANPAELRLSASDSTFISLRGSDTFGGISISPGLGNHINIQGMSGDMRYAGLLQDLPFPYSILPITPFTPFPTQLFAPPLMRLLPIIRQMAIITSSYVGA
jgi:hypothetical protein